MATTTRPAAKVEHTRNGCVVTVTGSFYTVTAEWNGETGPFGHTMFSATLDAEGYAKQRTTFGLAPGMYPDDPRAVAETALMAFSIGREDIDSDYWERACPGGYDERWIAPHNADRERLEDDRERFERPAIYW